MGTSLLVDYGWGGGARRIGTWDQQVTSPSKRMRSTLNECK